MKVALVSHVNGDGDLLEAWFKHYLKMGITSFHLIVHGPREENVRLYALKDLFPVVIEETYEGPFHSDEKKKRLDSLLARMRGQWIMLVDSDEFVELPYRTLSGTIRGTKMAGKNALSAPMLQRITLDGSLDTPQVVDDPFRSFPLCSVDLYQRMGADVATGKSPLFYCTERTTLIDGGNHYCPVGNEHSKLQGVVHHFKFRRAVMKRLTDRIQSSHPWRHESIQYQEYLSSHANQVPTDGAFPYSRKELFRRGLLRKHTFLSASRAVLRRLRGTVHYSGVSHP